MVIDRYDWNLILMLDLCRLDRRSEATKSEMPCFWYQFLVCGVRNLDTSFWYQFPVCGVRNLDTSFWYQFLVCGVRNLDTSFW